MHANDIRLSDHLEVLEEDILLDRRGVLPVDYLSSGVGYGVHAVVVGSGQSLGLKRRKKKKWKKNAG